MKRYGCQGNVTNLNVQGRSGVGGVFGVPIKGIGESEVLELDLMRRMFVRKMDVTEILGYRLKRVSPQEKREHRTMRYDVMQKGDPYGKMG